MPIIAKAGGGDFEKAPTGMQQAVCVHVSDIGRQRGSGQYADKILHKVIITWELAAKYKTGDRLGQPHKLSQFYTLSLGKKANLSKDLEGWRGRPFTEEERKAFDLENLLGKNCYLNVGATEDDKRKVMAVTPIPAEMPKIVPVSLEPDEYFQKWIQEFRDKAVPEEPPNVAQSEDEDKDGLPF